MMEVNYEPEYLTTIDDDVLLIENDEDSLSIQLLDAAPTTTYSATGAAASTESTTIKEPVAVASETIPANEIMPTEPDAELQSTDVKQALAEDVLQIHVMNRSLNVPMPRLAKNNHVIILNQRLVKQVPIDRLTLNEGIGTNEPGQHLTEDTPEYNFMKVEAFPMEKSVAGPFLNRQRWLIDSHELQFTPNFEAIRQHYTHLLSRNPITWVTGKGVSITDNPFTNIVVLDIAYRRSPGHCDLATRFVSDKHDLSQPNGGSCGGGRRGSMWRRVQNPHYPSPLQQQQQFPNRNGPPPFPNHRPGRNGRTIQYVNNVQAKAVCGITAFWLRRPSPGEPYQFVDMASMVLDYETFVTANETELDAGGGGGLGFGAKRFTPQPLGNLLLLLERSKPYVDAYLYNAYPNTANETIFTGAAYPWNAYLQDDARVYNTFVNNPKKKLHPQYNVPHLGNLCPQHPDYSPSNLCSTCNGTVLLRSLLERGNVTLRRSNEKRFTTSTNQVANTWQVGPTTLTGDITGNNIHQVFRNPDF